MNRQDFQRLAEERVANAQALLATQQNASGAYYMAGYAVECVLKACIAKQTQQYDYPDKKTVENSYTHNVELLLKTAKIEDDFKVYRKGNPDFGTNWDIVKDWSENSRYETHTQSEAENLLTAIIDSKSGVLQWIQRYW